MSQVVVLCGSLGASAAMWEQQLQALEQPFEVVRVEHPGHGDTPVGAVESMDDLVGHALGQIEAERFSFVGLSLGGAIGMRLALDAPERIEKLVLCCTSAHFGAEFRERAALVRAEGLEAVVDGVMRRWFSPSFPDVRRYREMFLSTDREGYARCCEALAEFDVRGRMRGMNLQTLCIAGEDDPVTPPPALAEIAEEISGARTVALPHARHLANVERAAEFNAALLEFL